MVRLDDLDARFQHFLGDAWIRWWCGWADDAWWNLPVRRERHAQTRKRGLRPSTGRVAQPSWGGAGDTYSDPRSPSATADGPHRARGGRRLQLLQQLHDIDHRGVIRDQLAQPFVGQSHRLARSLHRGQPVAQLNRPLAPRPLDNRDRVRQRLGLVRPKRQRHVSPPQSRPRWSALCPRPSIALAWAGFPIRHKVANRSAGVRPTPRAQNGPESRNLTRTEHVCGS